MKPRREEQKRSVKTAVAWAVQAWQETRQACIESHADAYDTHKTAKAAYLDNMPTLDCKQGVREYIACVAWAMQRGIFSTQESRNLLYAAQLSMAGFRGEKENAK